jgi:Mlc titration factor MtfA (ptsG expression regulator)
VFRFLRHLRRADVVAAPFPETWREQLASSVPLWDAMSHEEHTKLEKLVQIFLAEKTFEGAGGLELVSATERGQATDIRDYAAKNPAEFFAVVTELFFERPAELQARHPELYAQLASFYAMDPA